MILSEEGVNKPVKGVKHRLNCRSMHGQVQLILVNTSKYVLHVVPLIDADETLQEPQLWVEIHNITILSDCVFLCKLLFESALISLFVHDNFEESFVLILSESDLFVVE